MDISKALLKLRPTSEWHLKDVNDFNTLVWMDKTNSVPTLAEIQACINESSYSENRLKEYPSIGDQLDALWKGGQAVADMKAKIDAVKSKFPKPE